MYLCLVFSPLGAFLPVSLSLSDFVSVFGLSLEAPVSESLCVLVSVPSTNVVYSECSGLSVVSVFPPLQWVSEALCVPLGLSVCLWGVGLYVPVAGPPIDPVPPGHRRTLGKSGRQTTETVDSIAVERPVLSTVPEWVLLVPVPRGPGPTGVLPPPIPFGAGDGRVGGSLGAVKNRPDP